MQTLLVTIIIITRTGPATEYLNLQIVWAESLFLGCAEKVCSPLNGSGLTSPVQFIVCNYSPG